MTDDVKDVIVLSLCIVILDMWYTIRCRSLNKKESQLYAPLSNVGSVIMDQDAMYIDIGHAKYTPKDRLMELEDGEGGEEGDTDDDEGEGDSVSLGGGP